MFQRRKVVKQAGREREAMAPLAVKLGLDPTQSMWEAPVSPEARALDAYRVGQRLLTDFKDPVCWPVSTGHPLDGPAPALSKRGAKLVEQALASSDSLDAVSWMAQAYGRGMAAIWRRASTGEGVGTEEAELLNLNASRSDALADSAAEHWPVARAGDAAAFVADAHRLLELHGIDLDNPDAMLDLRQYFGEADAVCSALMLLLGEQLDDELRQVLYGAVTHFDIRFPPVLATVWNSAGDSWVNLFGTEPYSWAEMLQFENAGVSPFEE